MDSLGGGANLTGAQKDELMEKVKQEIALANFQELLTVSIQLFIEMYAIVTRIVEIRLLIFCPVFRKSPKSVSNNVFKSLERASTIQNK